MRVLIIEDEPRLAENIARGLRESAGYAVDIAHDGQEGLFLAESSEYDVVLIDAPPVLGISDGSIIAREVDYVILVIQHRRYPREISLRAKRAIEEVHGNCLGMVLNCVSVKSDDSYYYYSNYGNYYRKKPKKRKDIAHANGNGNGVPVSASARKTSLDSDEF